ncbi:pyridoxal phosphate-dependent aminotransferase [Tropicimonas sp. S265A]|uniref:pyridoxal phosphate-dependent aminotransferase n=1 Tax=Tropicimonas sp. S265A TaxID=3415134 RepID=UPI003C7D5496
MDQPPLTPLVAGLPATVPFIGPETQERASGRAFVARLGANESAFGPSPRAIAAMHLAANEVWMYGDPEGFDLRADIAANHGIPRAHVVLGEGIDGLLGTLVRMLIAPGDAVVTSAGAYPTFNYHVTGYGGALHSVPYRADHADPDALAAKAHEVGARLVYLANPDNPMGSWHSGARIATLLDALPEKCLLVLDEAYIEFAPGGTSPHVAADDMRLVRMRTFSKAYGLAGLRIGYALGAAPLISAFDRVRAHFGVGRLAQAAARAALADQDYLASVVRRTEAARVRIADIGAASGLQALASATNFVTLDCGGDGALARRCVSELAARDVFVRMPGIAPLDRCIRISAAPPPMLDLLQDRLAEAVHAAKSS